MASDEVAAGEGALRTCSARPVWEMTKSSTSEPSRLRPDAARAGEYIGRLEVGDVAPGGADERGAVRGVAHLGQPGPPPAAGHPVGARPGEGRREVARANAAELVRVAGADHQRRRPDEHVAVDVAGEMHAEERQRRVRDRVDQ
jgi:hypothetical protein